MSSEHCTDDHSSGLHCPVHGFDDSVPPPAGRRWHRVTRADGQLYSAAVADTLVDNRPPVYAEHANPDAELCGARNIYLCTRATGHDGVHVGHTDLGEVVGMWFDGGKLFTPEGED